MAGYKTSLPHKLQFRIHTPNLLDEVMNNKGAGALRMPLTIFKRRLEELAKRAIELDDPVLNILMLDLTLYEQADAEIYSIDEIDKTYSLQEIRIQSAKTGDLKQAGEVRS